ncbi:MAG: phosphotransferase [Planctomycetia bacterium]
MDDVSGIGDTIRVQAVCREFLAARPLEIVPLRDSGFSGSRVYRVRTGGGANETLVCKAFAPGVDRGRAEWIHRLMSGLRAAGMTEVPALAATPAGATIVSDSRGTHWELLEFRSGTPTDVPTPRQAQAAVETLARLHVAASRLPGPKAKPGPAPAVVRRIRMAERMLSRPWATLDRLCDDLPDRRPGALAVAELRCRLEAAAAMLKPPGPRVLCWIAGWTAPSIGLQPVLRDVWADHVLFADREERVAGIIDFHAAAIDTPATDVARLLGSWHPTAPPASYFGTWAPIIAAYERISALGTVERKLVPVLAATGVLFGIDTWFRWLIEEERRFLRPDAVLRRIDRLLEELPAALDFLADRAGNGGLTG